MKSAIESREPRGTVILLPRPPDGRPVQHPATRAPRFLDRVRATLGCVTKAGAPKPPTGMDSSLHPLSRQAAPRDHGRAPSARASTAHERLGVCQLTISSHPSLA